MSQESTGSLQDELKVILSRQQLPEKNIQVFAYMF